VRTACGCLALTALACTDPTTGDELRYFAIVPDSMTGWVDDTVELKVTSDSAMGVGGPWNLTWTVADPAVAVFTETGDDGARLLVRGSGTTVVTARAGALTEEAQVTGINEGDLLSFYTVGEKAWVHSPALDGEGNVYLLPYPDPTVLALDDALSFRWEQPRPASLAVMSPAVGADGNPYFSARSYTRSYSPDGTLLWEDTTHGGGETSPAIGPGGLMYVAGRPFPGPLEGWAIAAYDAAGAQVFRTPAFGNTIRGVTVVADSVVVGTDLGGRAFGLTLSGAVLWVDTLPSLVGFFQPSVGADGRTIYLPGWSHVVATDALTGERRWVWDVRGPPPLTPIVDRDGVLYVQTRETALTALNPDGTVKWSADSLGGKHHLNAGGAPALAEGGVLYVACGTDLCAVRTGDGSVRWRRPLPFPGIAGPIMIAPDSSIVFITLAYNINIGYDSARVVRLRGRFPLADAPWPVDGGNPRRTRRAPWPPLD
jgi:outer membrane protein assembly factor BamB